MKTILTVLSGICFAYGLLVLMIIGSGSWFNFAFIIMGAGLLVLRLLWNRLLRLKPLTKRVLCAALALCFLNFAIFEGCAMAAALQKPADDAKWVIVLGAGVHGDVPSLEFARRISIAADYLLSHPDAVAVTTGGCGSGEYIEEGQVAAAYLQNQGVPGDRILTEDKSTTTEDNFRFALDIIQNAGGSADDKVLIVSSGFHLYRAEKLAKAEGYTDLSGLGSTGLLILLPQYYLREYAARVRGSF